nr:hypothetical protein HAGR004_31750 [Bdellovibrio sp. HAGR004]
MIKFLTLAAMSLSVCAAQAQNVSGEALLQRLSQVRTALKASAGASVACETPQSASCDFSGYCGKLAEKAGDFYLYRDKEGRTIPNTQLIGALSIAEFCAKNPFPQSVVQDPFVFVDQFLSEEKAGGKEQFQKNRAALKAAEQRVEKVFTDMKTRVIRMLESKRTAENSAAIDNMIGRIRTVKYKPANTNGNYGDLAMQGCVGPNGYYSPDEHAITVCPQSMNMPEASLFSLMAHEIGHAFDPCTMAMGRSQEGLIEPDWIEGRRAAGKEVFAPVFMEKNPFKSVVACLQSPSSLNVKIPSMKNLLSNVDKFEQDLKNEMSEMEDLQGEGEEAPARDATMARFEDERQRIRDNYDKFKYCSMLTNSGHIGEAFSDWIAAEALASKIKEIPEAGKRQEFAFASQAHFYGTGCSNILESSLNKINSATQGACPELQEFMKHQASGGRHNDPYHVDSHPATGQRVDRIYYAKPELREALGCKGGNHGQACK